MQKTILIKGEVVQDIGYRLFLYEHADALDITEFQARNIEGAVDVLVGGEEPEVAKFVAVVEQERPEEAEVEKIEVEAYEGKIKPILIHEMHGLGIKPNFNSCSAHLQ